MFCEDHDRRIRSGRGCVLRLAGLALLAVMAAGSGCWRRSEDPTVKDEPAQGSKGQAKAKPKEDFERVHVMLLPGQEPSSARDRLPLLVKPGHWIALSETWVAHRADLAGELTSFVEERGSSLPQPLEFFAARIWPQFPAVLPKGQPKRIETLMYVPSRPPDVASTSPEPAMVASLRSELRRRGEQTPLAADSTLVRLMHEHEYVLVVLAAGNVDASAYAYLDQLPSVYTPLIVGPHDTPLRHYHVVRPKIVRNVPLPTHSLAWTMISHVIWDGLDPTWFSTPQQEAMLDWLHWGGQLVINGPTSLDKLRGSFLAPYLPGEADGTVSLDEEAFAEINRHFSLPLPPTGNRSAALKGQAVRQIRVLPTQPMVGVALRPHPAAAPMEGTAGLVWERRIGGGRTAVVRFSLTDPRIKAWKNLDGFVNSVLLRRPGREFRMTKFGTVQMVWRSDFFERLLRQDPWAARSYQDSASALAEHLVHDPRLNSTVRFLARDLLPESGDLSDTGLPQAAGRSWGGKSSWPASPGTAYGVPGFAPSWIDSRSQVPSSIMLCAERLSDWHFGGYGWRPAQFFQERPGGVASWTEGSSVSRAADALLVTAARVEIPQADFVWKVMAVYLVVLVPANALVFWLLGRLEWAWAAVPVLAVGAAMAVVRIAQLDIGFYRSRTEVALLEVQGGYPRGHLTRFTALYSSLSTRYSLSFEPAQAVALPHEVRSGASRAELLRQITNLTLQRDRSVTLKDVPVASNSTAVIRSEQFVPLAREGSGPGALQLHQDAAGVWTLTNGTLLDLRELGLFRLPPPSENALRGWRGEEAAEVAYVPRLKPGAQATLTWTLLSAQAPFSAPPSPPNAQADQATRPALWLASWNASPVLGLDRADGTAARGSAPPHRLTELAVVVLRDLKLLPGDVRLVAWTDQHLPGLTIQPQASQNHIHTLVVAHLARGPWPSPLPDANRLEDVVATLEEPLDAEQPPAPQPPGDALR